jgi:hypothetical protein
MPEETTLPTAPETSPEPVAPVEPSEPDLRPTPPPDGVRAQEWRSQHLGPHRKQFA